VDLQVVALERLDIARRGIEHEKADHTPRIPIPLGSRK